MVTLTNDSELGYAYADVTFCYGASCQPITLDWVRDFNVAQNNSTVILLQQDVGATPAGMYARVSGGTTGGVGSTPWRFVLPYSEFLKYSSTITPQIKVHFAVDTVTVSSSSTRVYRNGHFEGVGVPLQPSAFDCWVELKSVEADPTSVVYKQDATDTMGILQVSDGIRQVKDWVPTEAGVVKVDIAGHSSIANTVSLVSGAGLPLGTLVSSI